MYPSDEQLAHLRDNILPQGALVDVSRYGEQVTADGYPARLLGVDSDGQIYAAYFEPVMNDLAYAAFTAAQIT